MTALTSELNLVKGQDSDDTADYLTLTNGLAGSLDIIDGLFNQATGHTHSGAHQGGILGANAFADGTIPGAKITDGSLYAVKIADGTLTKTKLVATIIEDLFAGAFVQVSTTYTVVAPVMFVFCNGTFTVTLPQASLTNRPITVANLSGQTTVASAGGSGIVGGSFDMNTGTVLTGKINAGDAITWKSDGGNTWRAV
jgi:hypothetical protein